MKLATLGNRVRRALRGGSPGVTLIEALVAIVLVSIIAAAFMWALAVAAQSAAIADIRTNAESLARSQLEYVKSQTYSHPYWSYNITHTDRWAESAQEPGWWDPENDVPTLLSADYVGYRAEVRASALLDEREEPPIEKDGIQTVTIRVFHESRGDDVVITLHGYNREPFGEPGT